MPQRSFLSPSIAAESGKWWVALPAGALAAALLGSLLPFETYLGVLAALLLAALLALAWICQSSAQMVGFTTLIVTAVALPIEISNHLNSSFLLAAYIVSIGLLSFLLGSRVELKPTPAVCAASALIFVSAISFLAGQFPWFASPGAPIRAQVGQLAVFVLSAGLFLVLGHQLRRPEELRRLTWVFVAVGGATCLLEVLPGVGAISRWTHPHTIGSLFWIWLVAVSVSQAAWNRSLTRTSRVLLASIAVLCLFRGLVLNFSWASGWLPPLVAAGIILGLRFPRLAVGLSFAALPVGLLFFSSMWDGLMINEEYSWVTRLEASRLLLHMVERNPLLGFGPANYYHYAQLFPIMGWYVPFSSHNTYMDLIMQTGLLGLFAFGWLVLAVSRLSWRLHSQEPFGFSGAYSVGALAGILASLVAGALGDWIIPFVYNVGIRGFRSSLLFWVFLGGVLALTRMKGYGAPGTLPGGDQGR
jgi:hypothetical protein